MPTTTPNFGWSVPVSTDLVKDGATAIELLGDSIDASLVDLKGGTTGQVLAKASGTDMDFSWVAQDDSNAIQNAIVDAKGDIIAATANDTPARLAVGANDTVLTADSSTATGLKWAAPASSGGWTLINTGGTTLTGGSVTLSSIPATYQELVLYIVDYYPNTTDKRLLMQFNGDTTSSNYFSLITRVSAGGGASWDTNAQPYLTGEGLQNSDQNSEIYLRIPNYYSSAANKTAQGNATFNLSAGTKHYNSTNFFWLSSAAINSITLLSQTGNLGGGTVYLYGAK